MITDQRVIFAGDEKSVAVPLNKILSTRNFIDGVGFADHRHTYKFRTRGKLERVRFVFVLHRLLSS